MAALTIGVGLVACGTTQTGPGTGGTGGTGASGGTGGSSTTGGSGGSGGTGGTVSGTGGSIGSGGTGGTTATGGTGTGTGGTATGGTGTGTGGTATGGTGTGTGGTATGGTGNTGTGGTLGQAGKASSGGAGMMSAGGAPGTGGTGMGGHGAGGSAGTSQSGGGAGATSSGGTAGTGSGSCQKGQTKPSEVVIMGESFYAISPQYIQNRIQDDARKAGSLGMTDTYRNVAVSGQNMNYIATTEWTAATQGGASVKLVIMDGGGIDCLTGGSTCSTCASTFQTLLGKMGAAGVKDVIYTRYPEPGSPPGSNASLKACLDSTMPNMQTTCEASTSPVCHWVDLRPVWMTGDVLSDGLHPTQSGGDHVGDLIWSEMVKDCLAQ